MLQRLAEQHDPEARVWTSSEVPAAEQKIIILGTPLGHDEFVRAALERTWFAPLANSQFVRFAICVGPLVALCFPPVQTIC